MKKKLFGIELNALCRPQDDFYKYVTSKWCEAHPVPSGRADYGFMAEISERTKNNLRSLIEDVLSKDAAPGTAAHAVCTLYKAMTDMEKRDRDGVGYLVKLLEPFRSAKNGNDLLHAAGHGYVIKMLLEGDIEVVGDEVIDHIGILNPVLESEMNVRCVSATPQKCGVDLCDAPRTPADASASSRVTPDRVDTLDEGQVFVFGSNIHGRHTSGTAKLAYERFGAVSGKGCGLSGKSYAIPTMFGDLQNVKGYVALSLRSDVE